MPSQHPHPQTLNHEPARRPGGVPDSQELVRHHPNIRLHCRNVQYTAHLTPPHHAQGNEYIRRVEGGETSSKSVSDSPVSVALPARNKGGGAGGCGGGISDRRHRPRVERSVRASAAPACGWGGWWAGGGGGSDIAHIRQSRPDSGLGFQEGFNVLGLGFRV